MGKITLWLRRLFGARQENADVRFFRSGQTPDLPFRKAVKKPIPIRCLQIDEPFVVETKEGTLRGKAGDYLMVGVQGELYPCERKIFEQTYEWVEDRRS
ncbi:MAG: hypothetical protein KDC32_19890 [Saprospiraceae bacterium]|nr:hypothetical protein [Saprospiraceae bacterium]MCB0683139.1 hypothetical protein [Saprospiraceae bacterium]